MTFNELFNEETTNTEVPTVESVTETTAEVKSNNPPMSTGYGLSTFWWIVAFAAMIIMIKVLTSLSKKPSRSRGYSPAGRYTDEINRLEEESQRQMHIFREQMRQTQDTFEQQRIQEEMLRFQEQMRRDMETAQRAHDEAVAAAQRANDEAARMQQQAQQDFMNQQSFNDFNNFNNGMF